MNLKKVTGLCLISSFLACQAAMAEQPGFTISPMIGHSWFDNVDDDLHWSVGLGYRFDNPWAVELVYADTNTERGNQDADFTRWQIDGLYHLHTENKITPYLSFGLGRADLDLAGQDADDTLANIGGGVKYALNAATALRLDFKVFQPSDADINSAISLGITHTLGARGLAPAPAAPEPVRDGDNDGVEDAIDQCPRTPAGVEVDARGCAKDDDGDGVNNRLDQCPGTPRGTAVDARGCPLDSDGDGVADAMDACPDSPRGSAVNSKGCPPDDDGDGVLNAMDDCPYTAPGVPVNERGCAPDTDADGVADHIDQCPNTAEGARVDEQGCYIILDEAVQIELDVEFDFDSAASRPAHAAEVRKVYDFMVEYPATTVTIEGHTDSRGSDVYNQGLSERRARTIAGMLVDMGIPQQRVKYVGFGESKPRASNATDEGRQHNRRVVGVVRASKQVRKNLN